MSDQQNNPVTGTPIDIDGDRETDALLNGPFDVTGDGVADTVTADVDFDGNPDAAIMDLDEDGEADTVATTADLDGDGTDESVVVDVGMDGNPDVIVADVAGDGTPDVIAVDTDSDGEIDTALVDSDEDGVFDTLMGVDSTDSTLDTGTGTDAGFYSDDEVGTTVGGPVYDTGDSSDFGGVVDFGGTGDTQMSSVEDTSGGYSFDGAVADYSGVGGYDSVDDSASTSMIQDYSDDTSLEDPVTATDAWEGGLKDTYDANTEASNEAYQMSTDAYLAGDQEAAYDYNQQSLEYGATADQAWDTASTWDSSSSDSGEY